MAEVPPACQTQYGHRLASQGIPTLLELEKSPGTDRTIWDVEGDLRANSKHERFERALGSTEAAQLTYQYHSAGLLVVSESLLWSILRC